MPPVPPVPLPPPASDHIAGKTQSPPASCPCSADTTAWPKRRARSEPGYHPRMEHRMARRSAAARARSPMARRSAAGPARPWTGHRSAADPARLSMARRSVVDPARSATRHRSAAGPARRLDVPPDPNAAPRWAVVARSAAGPGHAQLQAADSPRPASALARPLPAQTGWACASRSCDRSSYPADSPRHSWDTDVWATPPPVWESDSQAEQPAPGPVETHNRDRKSTLVDSPVHSSNTWASALH